MLLAIAEVRYVEGKTLDVTQNIAWLTPLNDGPIPVDWDQSQPIAVRVEELQRSPAATAQFSELPSIATKEKSYDNWQKEVASWIHRNQRLELLQSQALKLSSNPNESERDFRVRLQQIARELRDQRVEKLRQRYAPKLAALEEKQRRAEQAVARETEQSQSQKIQTAISFGATLLSSFMGRKKASLGTLGRATTAARGVSRSMKEAEDVTRVQETLAAVSQQLSDLESQFQAEIEALEKSVDTQTEQLEKVGLKPTKANIAVKLVTLAWAPYWPDQQGAPRPAWQGN
jgi:DNA-binding ferritin-like protein